MAENILGALGEVGFREIGVKERPGLVVLRRTKMPALLVEAGFLRRIQITSFLTSSLMIRQMP